MRRFVPLVTVVLALALSLGVAFTTCRDASADQRRWIALADGFRPAHRVDAPRAWGACALGGASFELAPPREGDAEEDLWIHAEHERDEWVPGAIQGLWSTPSKLGTLAWRARDIDPVRLFGAEHEYRYVTFDQDLAGSFTNVERGLFTLARGSLYLWLEPGAEPPPRLVQAARVGRGGPSNETWRVPLGRFSVEGLPVWPGQREVVELDVPPRCVLRFATGTLAVRAPHGVPEQFGEVRFRVELDGAPLFEHAQPISSSPTWERHVVALPQGGARRAELAFVVEGAPALCAIGTPVVGPAELEPPHERRRPDVVLFVADTFRADNLATYGGPAGVTPRLDAFARESLVYTHARSPAMWTLPSQASMMTGIWPLEHGATTHGRSLPAAAHTLAEHLRSAGYRTAAVTDAGFITRSHGFDQGFAWFDEKLRPVEETVEAALEVLDADDARPLFLFVHTFRTHQPYRVSDETLQALGETLGIERDNDALRDAMRLGDDPWWNEGPPPASLADEIEEYRALYRGAAHDLDRAFGAFLDGLAARGRDGGYVVFTSDHGEAFCEHETIGHEGGVWEENIRVPLLVRGPRAAPRRTDLPATLVDLPATIADCAGVSPDRSWRGSSLLELDHERPVFAFQCGLAEERSFALIAGQRKLIAPSRPGPVLLEDLRGAFDLEHDPRERTDARDQEWARAVLDSLGPRAQQLMHPRFETIEVTRGREDEETLRRLGYLGD